MKFFGATLFMVAGMLKTNKTITLFVRNNHPENCVLIFAENCAVIIANFCAMLFSGYNFRNRNRLLMVKWHNIVRNSPFLTLTAKEDTMLCLIIARKLLRILMDSFIRDHIYSGGRGYSPR